MEDELRLSLLIAGTFFIVAVLAHGIWKIRKANKPGTRRERVEPGTLEPSAGELDGDDVSWDEQDVGDEYDKHADYDDFGVGKVRVVERGNAASGQSESDEQATTPEPKPGVEMHNAHDEPEDNSSDVPSEDDSDENSAAAPRAEPAEKLYGSVVTNPKPHLQPGRSEGGDEPADIPEPPGFLLKTEQSASDEKTSAAAADTPAANASQEVDDFSLDPQSAEEVKTEEGAGLGEQARRFVSRKKHKATTAKRRQEPRFGEDQMRIDFDESEAQAPQADEPAPKRTEKATPAGEQEVLVLNVRAPEDEPISGAALLPMLLTLGFKFGEQDIFHRHVNSNGKGPVLFSLANMFKPGVFDIDNLETFTTHGVSLFMILPIEGDPHQVFNMMHNAARKIADEFNAQVLDGRRSVLTKQGLQQYLEKIREFERQRMISRHD
ncbi:cell division protein ZipA [Alteromonas sp. ASW11-19]|uniref:Cell division protein ZipA n=1 Tax=Alteromonas salexigens TaxID=2982530 RepID=A0ABT2VLU6_9ALTE|nr:cell division protein ZipA [Alteromonas salexigens]MCU7554292.1 cell division protein ZipA [Alteromonas salexigens]